MGVFSHFLLSLRISINITTEGRKEDGIISSFWVRKIISYISTSEKSQVVVCASK